MLPQTKPEYRPHCLLLTVCGCYLTSLLRVQLSRAVSGRRTLQRQAPAAFMSEAGSQCPGARGGAARLGAAPLCLCMPHPSLPRTPQPPGLRLEFWVRDAHRGPWCRPTNLAACFGWVGLMTVWDPALFVPQTKPERHGSFFPRILLDISKVSSRPGVCGFRTAWLHGLI